MVEAAYTKTPAAGLPQDAKLPQAWEEYKKLQALPQIWSLLSQRYPEIIALNAPYEEPTAAIAYSELYRQIQRFAAGIQALGIEPEERIALFADNSPRWLIADQGTMLAGAVNVVRSGTAEAQELLYILKDSGSSLLIIEDLATLKKIAPGLEFIPLKAIILLSAEQPQNPALDIPCRLLNFAQVFQEGKYGPVRSVPFKKDNLATLMYTSGTTGQPKGVMITHAGLLSQIINIWAVVQPEPGDRVLSILPIWHAYERVCEYFLFASGCSQTYTNIRHFKNDLKKHKPQYMIAVPRIWEAIYEGVQKQLREAPASKRRLAEFFLNIGTHYVKSRRIIQGLSLEQPNPSGADKFWAKVQLFCLKPLYGLGEKKVYSTIRGATGGALKQVISGGGALAAHLDTFYEMIGVEVLVGYGLTETAVVLSGRRYWGNLRGSSGRPLPDTELKIVHPEIKEPVGFWQKGLVMARGPKSCRAITTDQKPPPKFSTPKVGLIQGIWAY